ncbi:polyketide cyclase [Natrialba sp. SSL1]|uniref:polyketide cyclase n=1 Tax=Natrialba sp. SSL1 TaxID=1869245 RepID=UPI0008F91024|nr:polyketide cyclase [Natrialba sp. SSL1]OIB56769.1 polyketide cyclase [Natrialba sp. SSL1]
MREVTVSRTIDVSPAALQKHLDPAAIVEAEGSFTVVDIDEDESAGTTTVVASGPGMQLPLEFEEREGTIYYTQAGERGPFSHMETWVEFESAAERGQGQEQQQGQQHHDHQQQHSQTHLTLRSAVSLAAPFPFGDRIAAWKRKGELQRALETFAAELE